METESNPGQWMTLTDYSSKYRVSISTLRRRIKSNQVAHQFSDGKYLLQDHAPMQTDVHEPAAHLMSEKLHAAAADMTGADAVNEAQPILSTATKLLNELKKAYMSILQEKEEQMIQLKEEVSDLKTLVRVLEQENDRLRLQHHARMNQ